MEGRPVTIERTASVDESSETSERTPTAAEPVNELAHKESRVVNRTKGLVYFVILQCAIAVGLWSHYQLARQDLENFRATYSGLATELLEGSERNALQAFARLHAISEAITSEAEAWPAATLPNFDRRTTPSVKSNTDPELYMFAPMVTNVTKREWEAYAWEHQGWIQDDLKLRGLDDSVDPGTIPRRIHPYFQDDEYSSDEIGTYAPLWQVGPVPTDASILLLDLYSHPSFRRMIDDAIADRHPLLSEVVDYSFLSQSIQTLDEREDRKQHPRSYGLQPVYESFEQGANIVGSLFAIIPWDAFFVNIHSNEAYGIQVVVEDTCDSRFRYIVKGPVAEFHSEVKPIDEGYNEFAETSEFATFARFKGEITSPYVKHCSYTLTTYPTREFKKQFETMRPIVYPFLLSGVFVLTAVIFALYDLTVQRRQETVMASAVKTGALVSSLFPKEVQERMLRDEKQDEEGFHLMPMKNQIKGFLNDSDAATTRRAQPKVSSPPIADLYPSASVVFADMVGFTSWSSVRNPTQVFYLLETIYSAFDEIAKARRVYKVETIGDCWMGACGLPEARPNHAVTICRFAKDIVNKMSLLVRDLEVELGPDTAELGIRVGVHSGQVTAGVLRGERARFQLFGDTVNTASRMESTGAKNRVHISEQTRTALVLAGKAHWVIARDDKVVAKGKGELQTYWLNVSQGTDMTSSGCTDNSDDINVIFQETSSKLSKLSGKDERLVQWNVDLLVKILQRMAARRELLGVRPDAEVALTAKEMSMSRMSTLVVDELKEVITLPQWQRSKKGTAAPELDPRVSSQLYHFVANLALLYRDNAFHNFSHASHVTMSSTKLFSRIIHPNDLDTTDEVALHDYTYGLTSDPLIQFSVIFSALIHDVDHTGVPNAVLVSEQDPLAQKYQNKSPAEQRSIDCAWQMLQEDQYLQLRRAIYTNREELDRFRQLVVCCVMSTDICDKELGAARKERWRKAFAEDASSSSSRAASAKSDPILDRNRKATIVLEHLIQASDVSHTMQHWHVYRRWNECLFLECMMAYKNGRTNVDPAQDWYKGELGFFDFYVIPTAKKLADCGVFGVSSDEYLNYAIANRNEWEERGREIVDEMVVRFRDQHVYPGFKVSDDNN